LSLSRMAARSALSGLPLYAVMLSFAGWRLRLTRLTAATNRSTRRPAQAQRRRALFQAQCPIFSPVAAAPDLAYVPEPLPDGGA
ncbi:hypothetical protein LMJ02_27070, partial [Klebsiella pneumoniae]|uniref:hypothetical protein n=4 Tax=Klebsiella pneumoniae TaxID=573 RepID=UPI001952EE75